jgi:hypothetical protein
MVTDRFENRVEPKSNLVDLWREYGRGWVTIRKKA